MTTVLLTDPVPSRFAERLRAMFPPGINLDVVPTLSDADFDAHAATADFLLVVHRPIGARELAAAPNVRFVQRAGTGYDNLDVAALRARGVPAAYAPGATAPAVGEHVVLLMLVLLKRFVAAEAATRANRWLDSDLLSAGFGDLAGAAVGLVGFGATGRAVAERLASFGVSLRYTARHRADAEDEARLSASYLPLNELLACSTIVSLHVPLTDETRGLIGAQQLSRMRPGALLINTSRGEVVDERALRTVLERGHLAGAGLDVLEHENGGGNPFVDLPQVVVTPHVAGGSNASIARVMQRAVGNITRCLAGDTPLDLVPGTAAMSLA